MADEALPEELTLGFADDFELGFFEADDLLWLRDLRATRTGRFQPVALSARNVRGMAMTLSGLSTTDATAASARSARTSDITLAGRRARAAWTRFVSRSTNICRSGSIQIDVPVPVSRTRESRTCRSRHRRRLCPGQGRGCLPPDR